MDVYLTAVGFEAALIDELGRGRVRMPGVVEDEVGSARLEDTDHAFARQVLPDVRLVEAPSIAKLGDAVAYALVPALAAEEGPWRLHVIAADPDDPVLDRRAALLRGAIEGALGERRKKVLRRLVRGPADDAAAPAAGEQGASGEDGAVVDGSRLVQVLLVERERILLSNVAPVRLGGHGYWPSPFVGGVAPIDDDWDAPSSAFRKLREAIAWLGEPIEPDHLCVDLGASPGGWTHVALAAGARVIAVDRATLDPRLMRSPRLEHVAGDAFAFTPEKPPVDWLLSDVIAAPERAIELLERWTAERLCRRFVVHLKFKGDEQYGLVAEALARVRAHGYRGARAKKLFHDKNEVTLMCGRSA